MSYGFSFDQLHSDTFNIVMLSVDRTTLPSKRREAYIISGRDGNYYDSETPDYNNREIRVQISFKGDMQNLESLRGQVRRIAKWLSVTDAPLVFDDEPDKAYTASIDSGIALSQLMTWGQCELVFNCQPFAETRNYITIVNNNVVSSGHEVIVPVEGTQDAPCIITIENVGDSNITGITIQRKVEM